MRRILEGCGHTRLRDERGVALVMALGFLLLLSLGFATSMVLTSAGARHAYSSNADQKAYALAEEGVNNAIAVVFADANVEAAKSIDCGPPDTTPAWYRDLLAAARTTVRPEGSVTWSGAFFCDGDTPYWSITATSLVANPTGPGGDVARRVTAKVYLDAEEREVVTTVPGGEATQTITIGQEVVTETLQEEVTTVWSTSTNVQTTTLPSESLPYGGAFFYAKNGNVSTPGGNLSIEVPIFATGNLDFTNATASTWIFSIARLINVGGRIITNGIGLIGAPDTTLATAVGASSTSINANGSDESLFNSQGVLKLVEPGCGVQCSDPSRMEFFKYSSRSSSGFAGSGFARGYGGISAPAAKAWPVGTIITGALEMHEGLGCTPACTPANKVWPSNTPQPDNDLLAFPGVLAPDMAATYQSAAPGPSRPRTCTGTPPVFDNNGVLDRSAGTPALPIDVAPAASYDCTSTAPDGSTGRIAWDGKTLTVRGTVFFDGDIKFGRTLVYNTGSAGATIYSSGGIDLRSAHFCAAKTNVTDSDCNFTSWVPDNNRLGLVAARYLGQSVSVTHNVDSIKHVQALIYCDGTYTQGSGAMFQGLVECDNVYLREGGSAPSPSVAKISAGFPTPPQVVTSTTTTSTSVIVTTTTPVTTTVTVPMVTTTTVTLTDGATVTTTETVRTPRAREFGG